MARKNRVSTLSILVDPPTRKRIERAAQRDERSLSTWGLMAIKRELDRSESEVVEDQR